MLADVFTTVSANAYLAGVECLLGAENLDAHSAPPRVVWVPTSDIFEGKRVNTPGLSVKEPRAFGTRWAGARVRVWALGDGTTLGDVAACEDLVRRFLAAVHQEAFGNYRVDSLAWTGTDGAELVQLGRACDVSLAVAVPLYFDAATLAPLTVVNSGGMAASASATGPYVAPPP